MQAVEARSMSYCSLNKSNAMQGDADMLIHLSLSPSNRISLSRGYLLSTYLSPHYCFLSVRLPLSSRTAEHTQIPAHIQANKLN